MDIHPTARVSLKAHLDKTNPVGVHIGPYTTVVFGAAILAHDLSRHISMDTRIGEKCFIGAHAIIMPGVTVGDQSIVAAGSVVVRDVSPNSIVAGNPARVIREGIETVKYGILAERYAKAVELHLAEMRATKREIR